MVSATSPLYKAVTVRARACVRALTNSGVIELERGGIRAGGGEQRGGDKGQEGSGGEGDKWDTSHSRHRPRSTRSPQGSPRRRRP